MKSESHIMIEQNITKELLLYIGEMKELDETLSMVEIILEFCSEKEIDQQMVQEVISEDVYFKKMLLTDCESNNIIRTEKNELEEW